MNSLVSIIIPSYNRAQFIGETLESVLSQTYPNWECIIVDDGSTDDTEDIVKRYTVTDDRFYYIFQENMGVSSARNVGLEKAKGYYIQFVDSDDLIDSRKLMLSLKEIDQQENKNKKIVITNFKIFKTNANNLINPSYKLNHDLLYFKSVLFNWDSVFNIPIHCGFFEASLFHDFRFPLELKAKEDWLMWLYLLQIEPNVCFIDKTLAYYRLHPKNMTKDYNHMSANYFESFDLLKRFLTEKDFFEYLVFTTKKYYDSTREFQVKLKNIKESNSFKVGFKIKHFLKKMRLLTIFTWIFNKFKKV